MSNLSVEQLELLLAKAHQVVIWTTQDTLRPGAAGLQHLIKARHDYMRARIDAVAAVRRLTPMDYGGCTCDPHKPDSESCNYHYAASLQPENHQIPWNCPTYYDGCNCRKGETK